MPTLKGSKLLDRGAQNTVDAAEAHCHEIEQLKTAADVGMDIDTSFTRSVRATTR